MKIYKPMDYPFSLKAENERIDLGFDPKDRRLIDLEELKEDKIQAIVKYNSVRITKDGMLQEKQYCSDCNHELIPLPSGKLLCQGCGSSIEIEDNIPLTSLNQELTPHISQVDTIQNEEAAPFFWSLIEDDASKDDPNYEVTKSYENGRIQHIKLRRGVSPTEYRIFDQI
jgi:hypothetical protein